jgi:benzoyl-CoA reductase subunit D
MRIQVKSHPDAIFAGAIGAALWGAFRHEKLQARSQLALAS